ncbi:BTB/POZ domain-containing protein KCTD7-like [Glandiceps talaboti]
MATPVKLDIGGKYFTTTESTLMKYEDTILAKATKYWAQIDGRYFMDRDGVHFGHILEYLRDETLPPANVAVKVYREAKFYGLAAMVEQLEMMGPVHEILAMAKMREEIPDYGGTFNKVISMARKKFMDKAPARPTTDIWVGVRYDDDDSPFKASEHECEFEAKFSTQDIGKDNTVSLVFTGQKDAFMYTIRNTLPTMLQHDLQNADFKFVLSHLIAHQHSVAQHCVVCTKEYRDKQKPNAKCMSFTSNQSDKGFGILMYCITFTWFEQSR